MRNCITLCLAILVGLVFPVGSSLGETNTNYVTLSEPEIEELVRRSYPYVAMFNVNNKFALDTDNPMSTRGYNRVKANTTLADHRLQVIARPNNDTLYIGAMVDVTREPVILEIPAFNSTYVSLMITGYDHYVNIPMSTRLGDFSNPARLLIYSDRTPGYTGQKIEGIDKTFEATGDFLSAVIRVMPHANEPARLENNIHAMKNLRVMTLGEYLGGFDGETQFIPWTAAPGVNPNLDLAQDIARFPPYGATDFDIFENNLLEVMQFVFNHTTFDDDNELDRALLSIYEPLGVVPGKEYDSRNIVRIDGDLIRAIAERVALSELAKVSDEEFKKDTALHVFKPKGQMQLEQLTFQSIIGPIGQPAAEAVYPAITTEDGSPMSAMHDYEIVMAPEEMPPATAFWSATLYDSENGFFIPNEHFKYSVGINGGMKLDKNGGIRMVIAADKPRGTPEENWLPINRGNYNVDVIMRIYAPDLERFENWTAPRAVKIEN